MCVIQWLHLRRVSKTSKIVSVITSSNFYQLIIFGTKIANSLKLYDMHSFSTSTNSRQRTHRRSQRGLRGLYPTRGWKKFSQQHPLQVLTFTAPLTNFDDFTGNWYSQPCVKCQKCPICCHQMCSFRLKMQQNPFLAGAPPWTPLR